MKLSHNISTEEQEQRAKQKFKWKQQQNTRSSIDDHINAACVCMRVSVCFFLFAVVFLMV